MTLRSKSSLALVLLAAVLAGCVGDPGVVKVQSEDGAPVDVSSTTAPATTNGAPVAVLTALINGGDATITDGALTVPAGTTVVFSSAGSSDPDEGTILTYAWTLDDAPAGTDDTLTQAFPIAGTHAVELTVSDGALQATEDIGVVVEAVAAAAPAAGGSSTRFTITALAPAGNLQNPATGDMIEGGDPIIHPFDVPAGTVQITGILKWVDNEIGGNFAWEADIDLHLLDPAGVQQAAGSTFTSYETAKINDTAKITAGTWVARVTPYTNAAEMEYTLDIVMWAGPPTVVTFEGSNTAAVNVGGGTPAEAASKEHVVAMPAGATAVSATLTWYGAGQAGVARGNLCHEVTRSMNDYDLYVTAGGSEQIRAADGVTCEFGQIAGSALPSGDWTFRVVPFVVTDADYVLEVTYV